MKQPKQTMHDPVSSILEWAFLIISAPFRIVIILAWALVCAVFTFCEVLSDGLTNGFKP